MSVLVAVAVTLAALSPLASASAEPVNDPRVQPGCHGQDDFGFGYASWATGVISNNGTATCPVFWLAYDTHDCANIGVCAQDLVGVAGPVYLKPGATLTISVNVPSNICKVQFDPLVGWLGAPLSTLARGAEYGTNMLAAGQGKNADNPYCVKSTPTPPPLTPTPTATPTLPPPTPTFTATATTTPPPTATGTVTPPPTATATPTGTQTPPPTVPPTVAPTEAPTAPPTAVPTTPAVAGTPAPRPPSAGTGLISVSPAVGGGFLLMVLGLCALVYVMGDKTGPSRWRWFKR